VSLDGVESLLDLMAVVKDKQEAVNEEEYVAPITGVHSGRSLGSLRSSRDAQIDSLRSSGDAQSDLNDKMNIAWRYNNLPKFTSGLSLGQPVTSTAHTYTHQFDLTKRIAKTDLEKSNLSVLDDSNLDMSDIYTDLLSKLKLILSDPIYE
jgi:PAXNEB protein